MAKQEKISFLEFKNRFNSEEACREYLYNMRWPEGFVCPKCGHKTCYTITTRHLYECTACHYQASVTVGTVMERTHLPLEKWFWGMYFVGIDKRGYSATQLARELELSYGTAWHMVHRIRKAMKDRDMQYTLSGIIEMDDAYFGAAKKGSKRGRGTQKAKVMIGVSLDDKGHPQYLKMDVVADMKKETVVQFAQDHIQDGSSISSDAYSSYAVLQQEGYTLSAKVFNPDLDAEHLKWLHRIISNAKALIAGTFHGLGKKHMQRYMDEYCYRFNRRHFQGEIFGRILCSCLASGPITYAELTR
jgi:transposase-like protein